METAVLIDLGFKALAIIVEQLMKLGKTPEDIKIRVTAFCAKVDAAEAVDKAGDIESMGLKPQG